MFFPVTNLSWILISEHTQDKQIQRDDEYYEGDNDNDHADGSWTWAMPFFVSLGGWTFDRKGKT
jgi:hypothetical protein